MPTSPPRPCSTPGCPVLVAIGGQCPDHPRRAFDARPSAAQRGYGAGWPKVRDRQLAAQPACAWCGGPATLVDHVVAIRAGGDPRHPSNLQSLCRRCHARKTAQDRHLQ